MSFNFVNLLYCLMVCTSWFIAISYRPTANLVIVCCCCFILNFLSTLSFLLTENRSVGPFKNIEFDRRNLLRVFPCVCLAYHWARSKTLQRFRVA